MHLHIPKVVEAAWPHLQTFASVYVQRGRPVSCLLPKFCSKLQIGIIRLHYQDLSTVTIMVFSIEHKFEGYSFHYQ